MNDYIECIYWGVFFDNAELVESSLHKDIANKHITFAYRQPCPAWLIGEEARVEVIGYGNDGKNEALLVEISEDDKSLYQGADAVHITLSIGQGAKPVDSAWLEFDEIEPWIAYGRFGYFGQDHRVHT